MSSFDELVKTVAPLAPFSSLFGGGGSTKVNTSNKTNVTSQFSIGIANQIGSGSPSGSGGTQTAPVTQSSATDVGSTIPVFGANPSSNPSGDLQSMLTGATGSTAAMSSKSMLLIGGVIAAGAVFFSLRGK